MVKEDKEKTRATKEDLFKLLVEIVNVEVEGVEKPFGIRPITWQEDIDIDQTVENITDKVERARERTRMIVWKGTVDPDLKREDVDRLPVGLVIRLAEHITVLSSYAPKNESESS